MGAKRQSGGISPVFFYEQLFFWTQTLFLRQQKEEDATWIINKRWWLDQQSPRDSIDPIISQELGERTAYLFINTMERRVDAKWQA